MKSKRLVILIVEDDPGDLILVSRLCRDLTQWRVELADCPTSETCLERLSLGDVGLVLLDYNLGRETGMDVLRRIREAGHECPVVFLTGMGDEQLAVEALQAGAADYLPKGALSLNSFQRVIANAVEKARLQEEIREQRESLERTNEELQRRNREIERFYHTVSHELKTPLTSAREFVSLLLDEIPGPVTEVQREYLEYVLESCDQLTRYVNDMLDVTRAETGKLRVEPEALDLGEVVRRVVATVQPTASKKGLSVEASVEPDLPLAWFDEKRIVQVLSNLLNNAFKSTPEHGSVCVRVTPEEDGRLRVSVVDSGSGIEAAQLESIFDRLYQVDDERADLSDTTFRSGLGLGLSICREIVRLHGGDIAADSQVGEGSTFHFTLSPAALTSPLEPKATP